MRSVASGFASPCVSASGPPVHFAFVSRCDLDRASFIDQAAFRSLKESEGVKARELSEKDSLTSSLEMQVSSFIIQISAEFT